jgi:hypothetical protein
MHVRPFLNFWHLELAVFLCLTTELINTYAAIFTGYVEKLLHVY